ncbi:MAG: NYN domain-containing protein [Candidatus Thorarchaeota archaeon]
MFSRDEIDAHIRRCRTRGRPRPQTTRKHSSELIVDGNNIAFYLTAGGKPQIRNLINARRSLQSSGYTPIIVVSAALKHKIDRPDTLREMIDTGEIIETARGQNDDLVIIQLARKRGAAILTNDRFLDWRERFPWLGEVLVRYRLTPTGLLLE